MDWHIAKTIAVAMRFFDESGAQDRGAIWINNISCERCDGINTAGWCSMHTRSDIAWHILWQNRAFHGRVTSAEICSKVEVLENKWVVTEIRVATK